MYHIVSNNRNLNKNQHNYAIEYEAKFDNKFSLSSKTKDPLLEVTISFRGGKYQKTTIISSQTCLWDTGATKRMIKM